MWIVEAKSSSPRPETQPNFDEFIEEIRSKLTNGFMLSVATRLQRHATAAAELPTPYQHVDLEVLEFRFVLVIHGHKDEWLAPLQEALESAMKSVLKTWALRPLSVVVLNEQLAKDHGLIL